MRVDECGSRAPLAWPIAHAMWPGCALIRAAAYPMLVSRLHGTSHVEGATVYRWGGRITTSGAWVQLVTTLSHL